MYLCRINNLQLFPSCKVNIQRCQPEAGCSPPQESYRNQKNLGAQLIIYFFYFVTVAYVKLQTSGFGDDPPWYLHLYKIKRVIVA